MIRANDRALASQPATVEEPPPRPGLLTPRRVIVLVGVAAWLAVVVLFVLPRLTGKAAPAQAVAPAQAAAQADSSAGAAPAEAGPGGVPKAVASPELDIQNRVINLAAAGPGFKYVKLSLVVQFADPKGTFAKAKADSLKTLQTAFVGDHPGAMAAFNDIVTTTVSGKTAAELATPQGKETLRRELVSKFNAALTGGADHVTDVLFTDFVMQ